MDLEKKQRIDYLVEFLNKCCDEYYNGSNPTLSDAQYDKLFDELVTLENETGVIKQNSPTQRAGYAVMSELKKVTHSIPLLSLAKTKSAGDVYAMAKVADGYLGLKMDGLTVKIVYRDGKIFEASTRGDGEVGEEITHNARVFTNIPKKIKEPLNFTVTGEAFIDIATFERINEDIENDEDKYSTPRNLAAGSVRQLDSKICASRFVKFMPFNVLEGMDDIELKTSKLDLLEKLGFWRLPSLKCDKNDTVDTSQDKIDLLKETANKKGLPIDGIVFSYDNVAFCKAQGKTSHHFKDGIAYKFGDPHFKTTLKNIDWNISRTGQLTPIAEFDEVEIDNTNVEKASLHNMTFIENLKLHIGDEILVSKRNMIIPHVEQNLSANKNEDYVLDYPKICPVCSSDTKVVVSDSDKTVKVLYCSNKNCPGRQIKKYTHFVSKQAMNIDGLSEETLKKFIKFGWITSLKSLYDLPNYKNDIITLEGFGEKSYNNLCESLENSKNTSLCNLLVAMNIPLIGKNAARLIEEKFLGLKGFIQAIDSRFDFTEIDGIGSIMNDALYMWFDSCENRKDFDDVISTVNVRETEKSNIDESNMFFGKTVVITGTFEKYSRTELSDIMVSLGAKVTGSVSRKTDYVLCGENAGSKLAKANSLSVQVIMQENLNF